jgi:hypothetical protein
LGVKSKNTTQQKKRKATNHSTFMAIANVVKNINKYNTKFYVQKKDIILKETQKKILITKLSSLGNYIYMYTDLC